MITEDEKGNCSGRRRSRIHVTNVYFFPSSAAYKIFWRGKYGAADHDIIVERNRCMSNGVWLWNDEPWSQCSVRLSARYSCNIQ